MLLSSVRYLYDSLRNPEAWRLGYLDSGLGIKRRYKNFSNRWQPHLDRCRTLQSAWTRGMEPEANSRKSRLSIAVLGAGRLYDVNVPALLSRFSDIHLFDADPSARRDWRDLSKRLKAGAQLHEHIGDITGVIAKWSEALRAQAHKFQGNNRSMEARWACAIETIAHIPNDYSSPIAALTPPSTFRGSEQFDAILSINLLSQIPLPWQDRISNTLRHYFPKSWIEAHEEEWLLAYLNGAEMLYEQHLRDLADSDAAKIMLITDLEYVTSGFRNQNSEREYVAALGRIELTTKSTGERFSNYKVADYQEWTWDIEPRHRRSRRQITHRVGSFQLERSA